LPFSSTQSPKDEIVAPHPVALRMSAPIASTELEPITLLKEVDFMIASPSPRAEAAL